LPCASSPLVAGHGKADYLLYVDGKVVGVIEAKRETQRPRGRLTQSNRASLGAQRR
jgi:type I restriction enzyme R subunit